MLLDTATHEPHNLKCHPFLDYLNVVLARFQVREISNQVAPEPFRWTAEGLLALQEVGNTGGQAHS